MSKNTQQGFSTIEVIAALVIFSIAIIPLTQVQISGQTNADYLQRVFELAEVEQFALNQIKLVNVGEFPAGEMTVLNAKMAWTSDVVEPSKTIVQAQERGGREISLYQIKLILTLQDGSVSEKLLYSVGWKEFGR